MRKSEIEGKNVKFSVCYLRPSSGVSEKRGERERESWKKMTKKDERERSDTFFLWCLANRWYIVMALTSQAKRHPY